MNFWYLVQVVKSRKWMILGIVAITMSVIAICAPRPKRFYEATAYMAPTQQVMRGGFITDRESSPAEIPNREVILSNLIILAKGGDVYQRARDFLALPIENQRALAPDLPGYKYLPRITIENNKVLDYRNWAEVVSVEPVYNRSIGDNGTTTDIISINVKVSDEVNAPYIANAVGYAFAQAFREKSREDYKVYAKFLEYSRKQAQQKLTSIQKEIAKRKQGSKILELSFETESAIASIADLQAKRSQSEADLSQARAALADINSQLSRQPVVTKQSLPIDMNPEVAKLKAELADAEAQLREIARRYKPAHETYKAAQAKVVALRNEISSMGNTYVQPSVNELRQELLKKRSEAEYTVSTAQAALASINSSISHAQARVMNLGKMEPALTELARDLGIAEKQYNSISEKYFQANLSAMESTRTGSIQSMGWARTSIPRNQGQQLIVLLAYGLTLSLIIGVMTAVWLDSIDNRMRNAADVEKLLELPVIGLMPQLPGKNRALPKLTHLYPLSPMAESYKILRTNILFALRDTPFKTLMVASSRPGEGSTTTICNLAIALAQIGKRIVLIDADMRRPALHKFFGVPDNAGLSTILQGNGNLADALQKTDIENLIVIPAGPQPTNPSELLGSEKIRELVERLEEHCDLVLFDAPSTVVFSDGPMLASWVDAVLMVVSADQVPRGTEVRTRDLLRQAKANIIGTVVNRMPAEKVDSCYFYYHYYPEAMEDVPNNKLMKTGHGSSTSSNDKPSALQGVKSGDIGTMANIDKDAPDNPFPE